VKNPLRFILSRIEVCMNQFAAFFPGQGSQSVGMGKEFYSEFAVFRETVEEASDVLRFDLKELIFNGPDTELTKTENAQPAILTVSTGCARVAQQELGIKTDINLGHSLGEYSALVHAGAFSFATAVAWVRERGLAMQSAVPVGAGTMCAILGASDTDVDSWCREATATAKEKRADGKTSEAFESVAATTEPANFNSPGQVVVSGSVDAVQILEDYIKAKGIRGIMAKRLQVSAPFHCSLMKPAREKMEAIFAAAQSTGAQSPVQNLSTPYIANANAQVIRESLSVLPLLAKQIDHPVLWSKSIENLMSLKINKAYEFGPGKVLQGLAKRIAKSAGKELEVFPIYDLESLNACMK
jgi:[acyl-carrier-protein] S-malonyltransferase